MPDERDRGSTDSPHEEAPAEGTRAEEPEGKPAERERWELVGQLDDLLETPLTILGFVWLALLVVELIWGLNRFLEVLTFVIWGVFIVDYLGRLLVAPNRVAYLRRNWLGAISLMLPALRVLRVFYVLRFLRFARAARSLRLVRMVTSVNRTMRVLRRVMGRRRLGYVVTMTAVVIVVGAAGILALENTGGREAFAGYGDALWWTAMMLTTIGSEYWPVTAEGRVLTVLLSIYSFAVFGYVTAALASFFIGQDAESADAEVAGEGTLRELQLEVRALRRALESTGQDEPRGRT